MRTLLFLLAGAAIALAGEPRADPVTAHLPADAFVVVRLAPPERFDAIGRELPTLGTLMEDRRALGDLILEAVAPRAALDRSKPIYWAIGPEGAVTLLPAAPGATPEEVSALGMARAPERFELLADGWIRVSEGKAEIEESSPLALLDGDVSLTLPVGRLVAKHRARIDEAVASLGAVPGLAREWGVPVPTGVLKLVQLLAAKVLGAVADVTDVHYALQWGGGNLVGEGWVRTAERSPLRRWFEARSGQQPNDLMGLLPTRSLWMVESSGIASALDGDVAGLLDEAFGAGAGRPLMLLLSPAYALHEHLTGHAAGAVTVQGMMAMGMSAVHEIRPEAPIAEAIAAIDAARCNRLFAGLGIPVEVKYEQDFAKSGETAIHRLTFASEVPQVAMFGMQLQTCFAVEGGRLFVVQSTVAESDLQALLLRVRAGERAAHPHTKAMERLMPDRHEGLSVNVGALKPILAMFAMAVPDAAQVVTAIPDDLWFSTALAVRDGHLHTRGDWPLKECLEFAVKLQKTLR